MVKAKSDLASGLGANSVDVTKSGTRHDEFLKAIGLHMCRGGEMFRQAPTHRALTHARKAGDDNYLWVNRHRQTLPTVRRGCGSVAYLCDAIVVSTSCSG